jgi:hypothetical protein
LAWKDLAAGRRENGRRKKKLARQQNMRRKKKVGKLGSLDGSEAGF